MYETVSKSRRASSLPAWGVRVEIKHTVDVEIEGKVTPRMGSAG